MSISPDDYIDLDEPGIPGAQPITLPDGTTNVEIPQTKQTMCATIAKWYDIDGVPDEALERFELTRGRVRRVADRLCEGAAHPARDARSRRRLLLPALEQISRWADKHLPHADQRD